jgi:hypothetical protein
MTLPSGAASGMARSYWISNSIVWWTCCQTAPPKPWQPGFSSIQEWRGSAEIVVAVWHNSSKRHRGKTFCQYKILTHTLTVLQNLPK